MKRRFPIPSSSTSSIVLQPAAAGQRCSSARACPTCASSVRWHGRDRSVLSYGSPRAAWFSADAESIPQEPPRMIQRGRHRLTCTPVAHTQPCQAPRPQASAQMQRRVAHGPFARHWIAAIVHLYSIVPVWIALSCSANCRMAALLSSTGPAQRLGQFNSTIP